MSSVPHSSEPSSLPATTATAAHLASNSPTLAEAEEALLRTAGVPVERHDLDVKGMRLHFLACGQGEPLVLLHGRGGAAALFTPIFAPLAANHRVLALDLPGWGLSGKPPFAGHSAHEALDLWMSGVLALLDALQIPRADVLGHSMGGFTALGLGLEHADRVRRLVLVDAGGLGGQMRLDERIGWWLKPERLVRWFGPRALEWSLRRERRGKPITRDARFTFKYQVMTQEGIAESGPRAFDKWVSLSGVHLDFTRKLRDLTMPTLLMWGDRDATTPYADALRAARALGPGHLVAFTGCGHSPYEERPTDFSRTLLTWLEVGRVSARV